LRDGVGCEIVKGAAVELLLHSAGHEHVDSMLALPDLCCSAAVARWGTRHKYRKEALLRCDKTLTKGPNNVVALCCKGEAIFQVRDSTPPEMLQLAYQLFGEAASLGSQEGRFLKGEWLVVMASSHGDPQRWSGVETSGNPQRAAYGMQLVIAAADAGLAKAYVVLGHCYEFPDAYKPAVFDALKDNREREVFIVSLYRYAAALNDPDGLNDIGLCYATGYGVIAMDFDKAVDHYVLRASDSGRLARGLRQPRHTLRDWHEWSPRGSHRSGQGSALLPSGCQAPLRKMCVESRHRLRGRNGRE
jgi:hypothetical protein